MVPTKDNSDNIQKLHERISELERELLEQSARLDESRHFAEEVAASNPGVTYVLDLASGSCIHVSGNIQQLTGYTPDEILGIGGRVLELVIHPDYLPSVQQQIETLKTIGDDEVLSSEIMIKRKDGTYGWVFRFSKAFKRAPDGSVTQTIGTLVDMTELKRMQEEWRREHEFGKRLVDSSQAFFVLIDADFRTRMMNEAMLKALGYTKDEVEGRDYLSTFVPERDREALSRLFKDEILLGERTVNENHVLTKDGRELLVEWRGCPLTNEKGEVELFFGTGIDITEHRVAEDALRLRESEMRAIVETSREWIWAIDEQGVHTYSNPAIKEILGYAPAELIGRRATDFMHEDDRKTIEESLPKWVAAKQRWSNLVIRWRHKDGSYRILESNSVPILNERGECKGYRGTDRDITERKKAEAELQRAFSEIRHLKEQLEADNILLREEVEAARGHETIVGQDSALKAVLSRIERVAGTDSTVLIQGETGTGKELIARAIHDLSKRKERPFVAVNCAAVPSTLVESELFGREKGAYTGALTRQVGRFEAADGSTIFLDEVAELSPEAQAKLLRVLEEGRFERLGSTRSIKVDIRIIAATNRNLAKEVEGGSFRDDLYYRLNVFPISVPPLRERREDIPSLVWHFVNEFNSRMGRRVESISQRTMDSLKAYFWPGNVRELRNVIERAMILSNDSVLRIQMPEAVGTAPRGSMRLEDCQRRHILAVLERTGWRIRGRGGAAEILDLKPSTLESKMAKLGIRRTEASPR